MVAGLLTSFLGIVAIGTSLPELATTIVAAGRTAPRNSRSAGAISWRRSTGAGFVNVGLRYRLTSAPTSTTVPATSTPAIVRLGRRSPAVSRITESALDEVVVTDTIPLREEAKACKKIRQLSTANLLAETMRRISDEESVSSLFVD